MNGAPKEGIISKTEVAFPLGDSYSTPYFYHLPKIHKSFTNPSGFPKVVAMESITNYFSIYVNHYLQPLAQQLPAYFRDCIHPLSTLKNYSWKESYLWVSLDIASLYTSIPHQVALRSVECFLYKDSLINTKQALFIRDTTHFCLTHNYFQFDTKFNL